MPKYYLYPDLEYWNAHATEFGRELEWDARLLELTNQLLGAPIEEVGITLNGIRSLISQRDGVPCDDERLASEVDQASWFIGDEPGCIEHAKTSRRLTPGV